MEAGANFVCGYLLLGLARTSFSATIIEVISYISKLDIRMKIVYFCCFYKNVLIFRCFTETCFVLISPMLQLCNHVMKDMILEVLKF